MSASTPTAASPTAVWGRWPWPWWIVLLPLLLVPLLRMRPAESAELVLAPLPQCVESARRDDPVVRPQLTLVIFDVSTSVIAHGGADPDGRSFGESLLLARALADQPCTANDRMGSVIFASTSVEIPPIPLTSLSVIESAIKRPPTNEIGGGTNLSGALLMVDDIANRYPDHDIAVILLSDMQVDDPQVIAAELLHLADHHLHLVALGSYDPRFDAAFDTVTVLIDEVAPGEVGQALADSVIHTRKDRNR